MARPTPPNRSTDPSSKVSQVDEKAAITTVLADAEKTSVNKDSNGLTAVEVLKEIEPTAKPAPVDSNTIIPSNTTDNSLESILMDMDDSRIIKKPVSVISREQVNEVIHRLSTLKGVSFKTMAHAIVALFRRGAANAGAPDSMGVEILCPETKQATELLKYEVSTILGAVTDQKNVRKLAETMAPEIISASLKLVKINPLMDLKGDLANRMNRKLSLRKEPSLTREEEICCCTYAQWMPNLNELANSTRLKNLLDEDLNARKKKTSKTNNPKPQAVDNKKVVSEKKAKPNKKK